MRSFVTFWFYVFRYVYLLRLRFTVTRFTYTVPAFLPHGYVWLVTPRSRWFVTHGLHTHTRYVVVGYVLVLHGCLRSLRFVVTLVGLVDVRLVAFTLQLHVFTFGYLYLAVYDFWFVAVGYIQILLRLFTLVVGCCAFSSRLPGSQLPSCWLRARAPFAFPRLPTLPCLGSVALPARLICPVARCPRSQRVADCPGCL